MKFLKFLITFLPLFLCSCSTQIINPLPKETLLYKTSENGTLFAKFAPEILVDKPNETYNLPGSVYADSIDGKEFVSVDTKKPAFYSEKREFTTSNGEFTNLIYRVHFTKTPGGHLGKGNNVGLLFIVTLDKDEKPLLFTSVHTCGCYLAFVPTSLMPDKFYPKDWPKTRQKVHSESLPYILDYKEDYKNYKIRVLKRDATHRIADIWLSLKSEDNKYNEVETKLLDLNSLEKLELSNGKTTSFYVTENGASKGFVKGSKKIYERMFMSWWALDWRIGQDKKFGKNRNDGPVFYTSIKPWARNSSDMRDFKAFLEYWGWKF